MVSLEWYMPVEDDALVPIQFHHKPAPPTVHVRLKRHAPKVRSGCITCKARRVKCDETKPACRRCTSTGRRCDGYNLPKPLLFEISEDKDERWSFHYFRDRTSSEILSFSDQGFWKQLVIQAGYSRDIVRHALVAIGSYHESVDNEDIVRRSERQKFAVQQYNKSITGILRSTAEADIEEILLATILFCFFENVRGEWASALAHLQAGLRILSNWKASNPPHRGMSETSVRVNERIVPIFDQLQTFATGLLQMIPAKRSRYSTYMPERFDDLRTARYYFYELLHGICAKLQSNHDEFPWPTSDDKTIEQGRRLLYQWYDVFKEFLVRADRSCLCSNHKSSCHFDLGRYHMEMQYWSAMIRLECKPFRTEESYDAHNDKFQNLVDLAGAFCDASTEPEAAGATECIGFQTSYLAVVGVVALRCRDPIIRREAIELMRHQKIQEGKWEAQAAAEVAENIMILEEAKAKIPHPTSCHDIPDTARLHLLGASPFKWNSVTHKFKMIYDLFPADLIKFRVLRSGIDPAEQEIQTYWIDRRIEKGFEPLHKVPLPEDVSGFFPQTIEQSDTKLWSILGGKKVAMFLERAATSQICQCNSCSTKNDLLSDPAAVVSPPRKLDQETQVTGAITEPFSTTPVEYIPLASPEAEYIKCV